MANPNFSSILDEDAPEVVERPQPYPVGHYLFVVKGLPKEGESSKKKTPFIEFTVQFLQAADDVDLDALKEVLKGEQLQVKTMRLTYYLTEASLWRLDKFIIEDLGVEGGRGRRQMISETSGRQFLGGITHEPSDDGQSVFARITSTAAIGDE
jgi:hypothetical protein